MMVYAKDTDVPVERSRAEIEQILQRYGAKSFAYGWQEDKAMIEFAAHNRRIRFILPLPILSYYTNTTFAGRPTTPEKRLDQALRQRWRALVLCIKAKLESVESGISSFEDEFLAYTVLPNNETASEWMQPEIEKAYTTGEMPSMFPQLGAGKS